MTTFRYRTVTSNLLIIFFLKLTNQFTTYLYSTYNSNLYTVTNNTCQMKEPQELVAADKNAIMNIFHFGYTFAALGGLLANRWFEFRIVLTVGGAVMTLAMALMTISMWLGLVCQPGFYTFVWLLHPLYMGLVLPCLFYGFVRWAKGSRSRMLLVLLYYHSADSASWIDEYVDPQFTAITHSSRYKYAPLLGVSLSLLFTCLSAALKSDRNRWMYEPPTKPRLIRYLKILTVFILLTIPINDHHVSEYQQEINVYSYYPALNPAEENVTMPLKGINIPRKANMAGMFSMGFALAAFSIFFSHRLSLPTPQQRIQLGTLLAGAVAFSCFIADLALAYRGPASPVLTTSIFSTAAFLDGVAEILALVAVYEFVLMISARNHALLIIGIALSIWSLAYFIRLGLRSLVVTWVVQAATADPAWRHCAIHALDFALLVMCLACARYFSFPLAFTLLQDEESLDEQAVPLLSADAELRGLTETAG